MRNSRYSNVLCYGLSALRVPPLEDFVEVIKALSRVCIDKGKSQQEG